MIYEEYSGNTMVYNKKNRVTLRQSNVAGKSSNTTEVSSWDKNINILRFQWSTVQKHHWLMTSLGVLLFNILGITFW